VPAHANKNVFINCPFDPDYQPLLYALVFAVHDCGFVARSALEVVDTGEVRIQKIQRLIRDSRYGIHDISRTDLDLGTNLPRFNMPLELGLFLGARVFGGTKQQHKVALVLEHTKYAYQKYCSDIAGQDVQAHGGDPKRVVTIVRNWLSTHAKSPMPGGKIMASRFDSFRVVLPTMCTESDLDIDELTFTNYTSLVVKWLKAERRTLIAPPT
jgi:hypothetical protein